MSVSTVANGETKLDVLSDIVDWVRLRGILYFDADLKPPWGITVPSFKRVARYHFVTRGRCFISVKGLPGAHALDAGALAVIPHGAEHVLRDDPQTRPATLDRALAESGYTGEGCFVYGKGDGGAPCRLVCGHFEFEDGFEHALLAALPPLIVIPAAAGLATSWLDQALRYIAAEVASARPGHNAIVKRLSEIVFVQTLRAAAEHPDLSMDRLVGYSDPKLARALHALHRNPEKDWTVASLAVVAGLSRTRFAVSFKKHLGLAPLAYVTQWRMQQARGLLNDPGRTVLAVANQVGYASEAAFSRAFRKHFGVAPRRSPAEQEPVEAVTPATGISVKRVKDPVSASDGQRVLVDRLWPRGVSKEKARIDAWLKDIAPSAKLRQWFSHDPRRWTEFRRRYEAELEANAEPVAALLGMVRAGPVTLVYASASPENNAVVLADYLRQSML